MMNRRQLLGRIAGTGVAMGGLAACSGGAGPTKRIAITMDDFRLGFSQHLSPDERDLAILEAFSRRAIRAAGFVTGANVDSDLGKTVLDRWEKAGHVIGNHCWSHPHASAIGAAAFCEDIARNEAFLSGRKAYRKLFRFPYLDEGNTEAMRDEIRAWLAQQGYRNAAVTIDSQDWAITERLEARLTEDPEADIEAYGAFYVEHVVALAEHYDAVATALGLAGTRHTLLVHHNILNGLFLGNVLDALARNGWHFSAADTALEDPLFDTQPVALNSGRSLLDVIAAETGAAVPDYPERAHQFARPSMIAAGL
ncbi:MAG: polysaccharide deacetylase family protein [Hyphomonas sp.]|uniref:polysaccharide deacetylase family protein n=1 Tax=Hyphomonas sp. TaxID=87 RepID=UPI0035295FA2